MKNNTAILLLITLAILFIIASLIFFFYQNNRDGGGEDVLPGVSTENNGQKMQDEQNNQVDESQADILVVADNLEIPWDITFLPDGSMLVTERVGRLVNINNKRVYSIEGVEHYGEGGLLGIALHPDFSENNLIYLYQTTRQDGNLSNRVVRYRYIDNELELDQVIFDEIPGAIYHDGGRIRFGPDDYLYISIGDATEEASAQNTDILSGSILRINDDGSIPEDNPFGNAIYSYGHRNPQGLAWDDSGNLWSTEHGRSGVFSGFDEINLIRLGENYGWPDSQGDKVGEGTIGPILHSGATNTWAPASALFYNDSLFFGGLRGEAIYEAKIANNEVVELKEHFKNEFGRIRTISQGPDGYFYFSTSNRDGRGETKKNDDKIIKVNPAIFN